MFYLRYRSAIYTYTYINICPVTGDFRQTDFLHILTMSKHDQYIKISLLMQRKIVIEQHTRTMVSNDT